MNDDMRLEVRQAARRLIIMSLVIVGAMLVVSAWGWMRLPAGAKIPVHWGLTGQVDAVGGKAYGLLWAPVFAVLLTALMLGFLVVPRSATVARSTKAYVAVSTAGLAILLGTHILTVAVAVGSKINVPGAVVAMVGAMFAVMGNYMGKMRRNRWMGIRTPWTRANEQVWDKTHRLGGKLFMGLGLVLFVVGLSGIRPEAILTVLLAGTLGLTAVVYVYSYVVWRGEAERSR